MKGHGSVVIDQRNPVFLQSKIERHCIRLTVGDDLRMENNDDVRESDLPNLVDRFIRYADVALDWGHPFFRSIKWDDCASPAGMNHSGTENVCPRHNTLTTDPCHPNIEAFCHVRASPG